MNEVIALRIDGDRPFDTKFPAPWTPDLTTRIFSRLEICYEAKQASEQKK
jgi:hypothetical protein